MANLAAVVQLRGDLDGAIAWCDKALAVNPKDADAHFNRGCTLALKNQYAAAIQAIQTARDLGTGNVVLFADKLQQVQRVAELEPRLAGILKKETQPANAAECAEFADLCSRYKHQYQAALRLFTTAFATEPALADKWEWGYRFQAACSAAQVGCGLAKDAGNLDEGERARWRKQAWTWLQADLAVLSNLVPTKAIEQRKTVVATLGRWRRSLELACVRDEAALARLPATERAAWRALWEEVAALAQKAEQ
jgi:tetratricopeptide (TPR) repeat protein